MLQCLLIEFDIHTKQDLGLVNPLVSLHATWEELDGFVDLCLKFGRHVRQLSIRGNAERIQLLFNERPNALDDLQVILDHQNCLCSEDTRDTTDTGQGVSILTGPCDDGTALGIVDLSRTAFCKVLRIGNFECGCTLIDFALQFRRFSLSENLEINGLGTLLDTLKFLLLLGFLRSSRFLLSLLLGSSFSLCLFFSFLSSLGFGFGLLLGFFLFLGLLGSGSGSGLFLSLCFLFCFLRSLFLSSLGFGLSLGFRFSFLGFLGSLFFSSLGLLGGSLFLLLGSGFFLFLLSKSSGSGLFFGLCLLFCFLGSLFFSGLRLSLSLGFLFRFLGFGFCLGLFFGFLGFLFGLFSSFLLLTDLVHHALVFFDVNRP